MILLDAPSWDRINLVLPFIGLIFGGYLMLTPRVCTKKKTISSIIILFGLMWLALMWADYGSAVFSASRQSFAARVILLMIMALFALALRSQKKSHIHDQLIIARLTTENEALKKQLTLLNRGKLDDSNYSKRQ
ncbi:MAG: hypothetical protein Q4P13_05820 [Psychrobacter sp.]|nr:hypothetical protein [Psychrobacter sp.]